MYDIGQNNDLYRGNLNVAANRALWRFPQSFLVETLGEQLKTINTDPREIVAHMYKCI